MDRLDRTMRWMEYFGDNNDTGASDTESGEEEEGRAPRAPWQKTKTNLPKTAPPAPLRTFLNAYRSDILGSQLNKINTNLNSEEQTALDELADLQKQRLITIKPCDKTGGVAIINTTDYINSLEKQLAATFTDENGVKSEYFEKLDPGRVEPLGRIYRNKLADDVEMARVEGIIEDEVAAWLVPDEINHGLSLIHI